MAGRIISGQGSPIDALAVNAAVAANYDPVALERIDRVTWIGTPSEGVAEVWDGLVTGAPGFGDVASLTLQPNATPYKYAVGTAATTTTQVAAGLVAAATSGSLDQYDITFSGALNPAGGDQIRITINAVPYTYTTLAADGLADIVTGLIALINGIDPLYTAIVGTTTATILLQKILRGVGSTIVVAVLVGAEAHSDVHTVTGQVANTVWTVTNAASNRVTCTHNVIAVTTDHTVGSATDVGGTTAFTQASVTTGTDPDQAILSDGGFHSWQHTVTTGETLTNVKDAMVTLINGSFGYVAISTGAVTMEVTRADYAAFTTTDLSTHTGNPAFSGTVLNLQALHTPLPATAGVDVSGCLSATGSLVCRITGVGSYDVQVWHYYISLGIWIHDGSFGTQTVNANTVLQTQVSGDRLYVEVTNFIGGVAANVTLDVAG